MIPTAIVRLGSNAHREQKELIMLKVELQVVIYDDRLVLEVANTSRGIPTAQFTSKEVDEVLSVVLRNTKDNLSAPQRMLGLIVAKATIEVVLAVEAEGWYTVDRNSQARFIDMRTWELVNAIKASKSASAKAAAAASFKPGPGTSFRQLAERNRLFHEQMQHAARDQQQHAANQHHHHDAANHGATMHHMMHHGF